MFRIIDITKKTHSSCCFDLKNMAMEFPTVTASSSFAKTHCASSQQHFYSACQTKKLTETSTISCTVGDINAVNIVAVKTFEKNDDEEEEECVNYGVVDEFYDLKEEILLRLNFN